MEHDTYSQNQVNEKLMGFFENFLMDPTEY